jgi:hypothetical protein
MTPVLAKIQRLIALAANDSAPAPEARTAAHVAARLIHGHRIELHDPAERATNAVRTKMINSRYAGRCNRCGGDYVVGEVVAWTKDRGAAHAKCVDV